MKKNRAIIVLLVILLAIGGLSFTAAVGIGPEKAGAAEKIKLGLDLAGGVSITYQVVGDETPSSEDMNDTVYKLQRRVESYSTEAQVYQEGSDRINIQIPGVSDANAVLEELGKPGSLYFMDKDGNVIVDGTQVKSASAVTTSDQTTGGKDYAVDLILTDEGAAAFAEATRIAAPNRDIIYIYYDDQIVSAPVVETEISGGEAFITHMESLKQRRSLRLQSVSAD